jgi:hypothetical protein
MSHDKIRSNPIWVSPVAQRCANKLPQFWPKFIVKILGPIFQLPKVSAFKEFSCLEMKLAT